MKLSKKLLFILGAVFLPLTSGCSNINSVKEDEDSSINDNVDDNFNNETITEDEKERETLKTLVFNNLNENNHYHIKRDSYITFISDNYVPTRIGFIGEVIFNQSNVSYSSLDLDYSYSNKVESISIINNFSINSTLKHNNNIVTFDSNSDLTYMLNYLNLNEGYKDAPTFSYNNLSLSTVFNNVFNSLFSDKETSKYTTIDDSININESSILVKNNEYSIYLDDSFNIKRIAKNNKNSKDINLPIQDLDLSFTNTYNTVSKLNENSDNIFTTLFEYFEDSALNIDFDINVDSSKDFHFIGDMNLDFTNSSLVNNNKFDINFLHYTNKNTANDKVYLRYENNNAYFEIYENLDIYQNTDNKDPFLKGRMSDTGISSLLDVVSNYTDIDFNEYVNMPLNSLFNTTSFKEISTTRDISSYLSSIKSYSLKNNLLSLKIDSSVFGLPESILDIKIGLHNLKLKTIEIKNLRVDEETTIDASLRINDLIELKPYDLSSFPSYDFLPGMIESVTSLINRKTLGGKLSFQLFNLKNNSNIGFSSNIDLNASKLDFNNLSLDSISNFDLALTNFGISGINETIASIMNMVKGIYIQDDPLTNKKSLIIEINLFGEDKYICIPFEGINSLISTILELLQNTENSINIDFEQILGTINYYIDEILENYELTQDIQYIMDNISLRPLEKFLKIDVNEEWETLEITVDPEYIFQYEMAVNDPSFSPYIKILYDTRFQELIGIYVNIATHDGNYVINFNYGYDDFNKGNFVDSSELNENNKLEISIIMDLIDLFTNQNSNAFETEKLGYNLSTSLVSKENAYGVLGNVFMNYQGQLVSGNMDLGKISSLGKERTPVLSNPMNVIFKYYGTKNDENLAIKEYDGMEYYEDIKGNKVLKDTIVANLRLNKKNKESFKIVSPASSILEILKQIKTLQDSNLLYSYLESIINALNSNFIIMYLIENKEIETLISDYIKIKKIETISNEIVLEASISSAIFDTYEKDEEGNITIDKSENPTWSEITLKASKEYNEETKKNLYSIDKLTLDSLSIPNLGTIDNLTLERDENLTEDNIFGAVEGDPTTHDFVDYDYLTNKSDFINVKDLSTLITLGINSTYRRYFKIKGKLDVNIFLKYKILGLDIDLGSVDLIEPRTVTAMVEVCDEKAIGADEPLYSGTRSHIIIERAKNTNDQQPGYMYNTRPYYIEYFTKRLEDGTEICYVSKTTASFVEKGDKIQEKVEDYEVYSFQNDLSDDLRYLGYNGTNKPIASYHGSSNNKVKVDQYKYIDSRIYSNKKGQEERAKKYVNNINQNFFGGNSVLGYYDNKNASEFTIYTECEIYRFNLSRPEISGINEDSYNYSIETFKLTQAQLLGSTSYNPNGSSEEVSVPNILYYLVDYTLIDEVTGIASIAIDRDEIMGIIYYQVGLSMVEEESIDTTNTKTLEECIGNFTNKDDPSTGNGSFSMTIDLGGLINMEGFNGLFIELNYGPANSSDLSEDRVLKSISIRGCSFNSENKPILNDDNFIMEDFYNLIDVGVSFSTDEGGVYYANDPGEDFYRWSHFIEAFESYAYIYNEPGSNEYAYISGFTEGDVFGQTTITPVIGGYVYRIQINTSLNQNDSYYGLLYGLIDYRYKT